MSLGFYKALWNIGGVVMRCDNGGCNTCRMVGIFASVLLAIAVGILSFFGFFAFPEIGLYTALILGLLAAGGVIVGMSIRRGEGALSCCLCTNASQILTGAVGAFLFALTSLVIGTEIGAVIGAILAGLTALFFLLLISGLICFAVCLVRQCD